MDLGIIEDVGYMAAHSDIASCVNRATWATGINEAKLHQILEKSITLQQAQLGSNDSPGNPDHQLITDISYPQPQSSELVKNPRFRTLQVSLGAEAALGLAGDSSSCNDPFAAKIQELMQLKMRYASSKQDKDVRAISEGIMSMLCSRLAETLALPGAIEPGKPLAGYGLDSLAAVEMRNWIRLRLQVDILTLELTSTNNVAALGTLVGKRLVGVDQLEPKESETS